MVNALAERSGLKSKWPVFADLSGSDLHARFEGEIGDLIVYGDIPPQIDGTFYRISLDRYLPREHTVPIDGDGTVSAFRIHDGIVDFKVRYVGTERYKLERRARKTLFGLYKNPWSHHPCVRSAVDSTGSTNVIHWANRLLVLEEAGNPYVLNVDSLDTLGYDPFYDQIKAKAFTAHPKIDPFTSELVGFGYEAKGPATDDIVTWSIGKDGKKTEELWIKAPFATMIHDCGITENYLILMAWPFEASIERMKAGGLHWAYRYDRPSYFIVVPRRAGFRPPGWGAEEQRRAYRWKNCMNIHTAGSWEEDGKLYIEASRVHDNVFPFFPAPDKRVPEGEVKADLVRWEIDPTLPDETYLPDPKVILDLPSEFPRIDERLTSKKYNIIFLNVFIPQDVDGTDNLFHGLNTLAMINTKTGDQQFFSPGAKATIQEPVFIPRSDDAPEGDGWVIAMVEQLSTSHCELVVLDTRDFTKPIAIAQLPFRVKSQIHGNWVDWREIGERKSLVTIPDEVVISGKGCLEPL